MVLVTHKKTVIPKINKTLFSSLDILPSFSTSSVIKFADAENKMPLLGNINFTKTK